VEEDRDHLEKQVRELRLKVRPVPKPRRRVCLPLSLSLEGLVTCCLSPLSHNQGAPFEDVPPHPRRTWRRKRGSRPRRQGRRPRKSSATALLSRCLFSSSSLLSRSMSLKYEPASEPLHIYVKWLRRRARRPRKSSATALPSRCPASLSRATSRPVCTKMRAGHVRVASGLYQGRGTFTTHVLGFRRKAGLEAQARQQAEAAREEELRYRSTVQVLLLLLYSRYRS